MLLQWLSSSWLYCCYCSYINTPKSQEAEFYPSMRQFALSKSIEWVGGKMGSGMIRLIGAQLSWRFHRCLNQSSLSSVCVGARKGIAPLQPRKSLLDTFKILQKLRVGWLLEWTPGWLYHGMVQQQPWDIFTLGPGQLFATALDILSNIKNVFIFLL